MTNAEAKGIAVNWINESFGGFGKTTLELLEESENFSLKLGFSLIATTMQNYGLAKNHPPKAR